MPNDFFYRQWYDQALNLALAHGLHGSDAEDFRILFAQAMWERESGGTPELLRYPQEVIAEQLVQMVGDGFKAQRTSIASSTSNYAGGALSLAQMSSRHSRSQALQKILLSSAGMLAGQLLQSRRQSLTESFDQVFAGSGSGAVGIFTGTLGQIVGTFFGSERTRTTSTETDRSREAQALWNLSRSQQQAMLTQNVQRGMRNL